MVKREKDEKKYSVWAELIGIEHNLGGANTLLNVSLDALKKYKLFDDEDEQDDYVEQLTVARNIIADYNNHLRREREENE